MIDRGTYLDWTVALGPHDGPGSVRGLLGSNTGQTNDDFQLRDGTVLAQPLSEAEILSTFADAWTVAPAMSLLDETKNIVVTDPPPLVAAATISNGASLEISSASVNAVTFAGPSGILQLDQSQSFRGTIAGFGGGDQIDLRDIVFGANTTLGYSANSSNNGGTLMVSDRAHTANISLLGQYMAASFAASSDGHGGTIIGDSPVLAQSNLTQPHA